jgi:hypothetical protein
MIMTANAMDCQQMRLIIGPRFHRSKLVSQLSDLPRLHADRFVLIVDQAHGWVGLEIPPHGLRSRY